MVQFAFDARTVQPAEAGQPIWEGVVPMTITRTEAVKTADGSSSMLVLHVRAAQGQYQGQENVLRLNLWNKNPKASEIAQRQLSSICHVTGKMQMTDSDQLVGGNLLGVWALEEREVTDQQTGQSRKLEGCQCKDYRMVDGRTIKEAIAGAAPANPYNPGAAPQPQPQAQPQAAAPPAAAPGGYPQPAPQGPQPGAPGFPQPGAMQPQPSQYAPPMGAPAQAGGFAPSGQGGAAPAPAMPGFSTAGSPSSPGVPGAAPGGFGGGGFAPAGAPGAPAAAPGGFAPQAQPQAGYGAPQAGGFQPPAGAGPWGQ